METLCACGHFKVDTATARYQRDGKPLCDAHTCAKAREHEAMHLRRGPFFDDIEHDRIPDEVQASFIFEV